MLEMIDLPGFKNDLNKAIKHLEHELGTLQLGRASSGLVENLDIFIPSLNDKQKISWIASVNVVDAQTIKIEPRDKGTLSSIEKGIYDAGIGLTPLNQGDYIMIKVPPLTQERRQELTKLVNKMGEEAKIAVRNIRHDYMNHVKKDFQEKLISETEKGSYEKQIEDNTKDYNTLIDSHIKNKNEDVMKV